jgi:uroporphyrinogen decarboxylase
MKIRRLTSRERIENLLAGKTADRVPFCPAVYEHKAALIGETPSRMSRDAGLLEKAIVREIEVYQPDMVVVGCDVYNVEAEAAGCKVRFYDSNDVPSISEAIIAPGDDISGLRAPDPEKDGRMPVNLEAGERIQRHFGRERIIRGALSAPFSLASELAGPEPLLLDLMDQPEWVSKLLAFSASVIKAYGKAFVERGLGVILFDSHASPPLVSPRLYEEIILPPTAEVIRYFRFDLGVPLVPYIIGGDTRILIDSMLATGTNNILCDYKSDLGYFVNHLKDKPVLLRANVDPSFLLAASIDKIKARVREVLAVGRRHPGFMLGTGILPYDMLPEKIIAVREALAEAAS